MKKFIHKRDVAAAYDGKDRRKRDDFESYFNAQYDARPRHILPGQSEMSDDNREMITANIAYGVGVGIYDPDQGRGSFAYVSVPQNFLDSFPDFKALDITQRKIITAPIKNAITVLIGDKEDTDHLRVRLTGASQSDFAPHDPGTKNYIFVKEYIARQGLRILNEDIGGSYARRVCFFPSTGRLVRIILRRHSDFELIAKDCGAYEEEFLASTR